MKSVFVIITAIIIAMFVFSTNAQDHAAHHPDEGATVQTDTSGGMDMMEDIMQGEMMTQQGMRCPMCGKMMKGGIMGNMKNMMHGQGMMKHRNPTHRFMHLVYHLPDMKTKLGLSEEQIVLLRNMQADFLKQKVDWEASIQKKEIDLNLLLDKNATPGDVGKILESIYDVKLQMKVSSYETAQKMRAILSADQEEKLDKIFSMCMGQGMMRMKNDQM
jgi:hypothetical protein